MHRQPLRLLALSLVGLAACGGGGGGGSSGGVSNEDRLASAQATQAAAVQLFRGSDDFDALVASLDDAKARDPNNAGARLFHGIGFFLRWVNALGIRGGGRLRALYVRSGFAPGNPNAGFWRYRVQAQSLQGQGEYANSAPTTQEVAAILEQDVLPALRSLAAGFESVPSDFRWQVQASDLLQHPLANPGASWNASYEIDRGDALMAAAALRVFVAAGELALAYQQGDVDINDFDRGEDPSVDPLAVFRDRYPDLGNVARTAMLAQARASLEQSFDDYADGAAILRAETPAQQAAGLLTIAPDRLIPAAQQAQFLADEAAWRDWVGDLVDAFGQNANTPILYAPDGTPLPQSEQFVVNFGRFFAGVDARSLLFKLVVDPRTGKRRLGVTSLAQIDAAMRTADGVLPTARGVTPSAGDLQANGVYAVRVDAPPSSTKSIDGAFGDWANGAVKIGDVPAASVGAGAPSLGNVFASVGNGNLFLRVDADLQSVVSAASYGRAAVEVAFHTGGEWEPTANIEFDSWSWQPTSGGSQATVFANNLGGLEAAIAVPAGVGPLWASVAVEVKTYDANYTQALHNRREAMFVRVR